MAGGLRFHRHSLIERSLGNYFQDIVLQHSSAHKHTARPMSFLNRLVHRGQRWVSLIFTGLILSGALYLILAPLPPAPAAKPKTAEEIEEVESWTKTELFGFLSRHQVFPDIDTRQQELVRLVKSIMNLYPDMDNV